MILYLTGASLAVASVLRSQLTAANREDDLTNCPARAQDQALQTLFKAGIAVAITPVALAIERRLETCVESGARL